MKFRKIENPQQYFEDKSEYVDEYVMRNRLFELEKENSELRGKIKELQEITDAMDKTLDIAAIFTKSLDDFVSSVSQVSEAEKINYLCDSATD